MTVTDAAGGPSATDAAGGPSATDAVAPGRTVAVVGAGAMGRGTAQVALLAGHRVRLHDTAPAPAPGRAERGAEASPARLADGRMPVEFPDAVYFDLALDHRAAAGIALSASETTGREAPRQSIGLFQALGKKAGVIGYVPGMIVARTVAMLVDAAADAAARGVASPEGIGTALRLGAGCPVGPAEWGRRLGRGWAHELPDELHARVPAGRYAPSPGLYRQSYVTTKGDQAS
ncbi:3-hydroxyacyl-CoA dehydrogenase family protein [Streptomyces pacificus]|uniref:3-hydroxyacyl-CoA dehydrogenase NAD binding domain-containing protein n=1 Tax=Streptomyces pacificus TaxID=2705029 RepID=A0A6A0AU52_9ACTN|nr:hypothetical protein SCWH03_27270 [Streptomyces pacificus]